MPRPGKTQKTAKGCEISVPTRGEVNAALAEIAKDSKPLPVKMNASAAQVEKGVRHINR